MIQIKTKDADDSGLIAKARKLATYCVSHRFDGIQILKGMKLSQLSAMYDGIGPDWSGRVIAGIIEHIHDEFEPAAFLLDVQYRIESDRSDAAFHRCNHQFYDNCVRCAKASYGWWRPKRYRLIRSAKVLLDACEEHGMECWRNRGEARRR